MNLKISLRFLIKNKLLSLLSILVLTFGMLSFILILSFIQYEKSFDKFWTGHDSIYRVILEKSMRNGNITTTATNYNGLCRVIKDEIPGIVYATGFQRDIVTAYTSENFLKDAGFFWCDTSFFKVFDRPFIAGDRENPFPDIQSAVISETVALSLFGRNDVINQRFKVNEGWEFVVSGIFADIPENSHLKIDILSTRKSLHYFIKNFDNNTSTLRIDSDHGPLEPAPSSRWLWENPNVYTYIRLKPDADFGSVTRLFQSIYENYTGHLIATGQKSKFCLQPVQSIHLDSHYSEELSLNSERKTIMLLYVIAILALVMSWVIFINFQITQSIERTQEFGIKKVAGASPSNLVRQLILQSVIINCAAILFAFCLFWLLRGKVGYYLQIPYQMPLGCITLLKLVAIFISGSILSSINPAFILISKSARQLLTKKFVHGNDGFKIRRSLVVFQYSASIGLMITTFVIIRQVWFMKNKEIGLDIDQTAYSYTPMSMIKKQGATQKLISFLDEVNKIPGMVSCTINSCMPGNEINFHSNTIYASDKPENRADNFGILTLDHHYQEVFKPKILAGHMYSSEDKPGAQQVVINREASKKLGFGSPAEATGQYVQISVNDYLTISAAPFLVCGVIEDFLQESPRKKVEPVLFIKDYRWKFEVGFIAFRYDTSKNRQGIISKFKEKWETFYPDDPFAIQYTRDTYEVQLKTDEKLAILSLIYTCLSIVLSALGLYGLAANASRKRIKEIGIRKINGAKISQIMLLLNQGFIKWVIVSFLIAAPPTWYLMRRWLGNFAYRTELSWWLFVIAAMLAISIALLTVTWQTWKAASMNPVDALRYE